MNKKIKLFVVAPIIGGLLLLVLNTYQLTHQPYQPAIFEPIQFSYWIHFFAFLTGYVIVALTNLVVVFVGET